MCQTNFCDSEGGSQGIFCGIMWDLIMGHEILSEPPRGVAWLALTGGVLPC